MESEPLVLWPWPRHLRMTGGRAAASEPADVRDPSLPSQGFVLEIAAHGTRLAAADDAGERYGRALLEQIQAQCGGTLPCMQIEDHPDFPVRGWMLDVSRDRVPTRDTLAQMVDWMDALRLNHLELYTEHTFAYREHETVWRHASPLTPDDIRWLDARCTERGIELCANQNTFGHMARWLAHPEYRDRAEAPEGWTTRFGFTVPASVLAPNEDNARFALDLCRELLGCFRSRRINIGCDETFELGQGLSRAAVDAHGRGRVYLEHLQRLLSGLHAGGHEVLFWGDILRNHPELVPELPRTDTIALAWHYEAPNPDAKLEGPAAEIAREFGMSEEALRGFSGHVAAFAESDFPFWVCPGTSSWNSFTGRWTNARGNLVDAAETGRAAGARGFLITDWGDNGHHQPPAASLLPLTFGAGVSWCLQTNRDADPRVAVDALVGDPSGRFGRALEAGAEVYARTGKQQMNGSPLFTALVHAGLPPMGEADADALRGVLETLDAARADAAAAQLDSPGGALLVREWLQALRLARHGALRLLRETGAPDAPDDVTLAADLARAVSEQRACWLLRSREGGLSDSLARLRA